MCGYIIVGAKYPGTYERKADIQMIFVRTEYLLPWRGMEALINVWNRRLCRE